MQKNDKNITRIYMPLLNEGTLVVRPISAEVVEDGVYRVLPLENTSTEQWEFPPGSIVRCNKEVWDGDEILVVREILSKK